MSEIIEAELPCADCGQPMSVSMEQSDFDAYQDGEVELDDLDIERICDRCGSDQDYDAEGNNVTAL
ncbi:MAG: hypothetical protein CMF12_01030 [Idiomarina sp.]|uniref:hypothetical protein n=1 Tax=Idiomarina sp. TaxID=1874361 RepID=UPI000C4FA446|nr:hypothetical protein [Idiomarina sp.]MBT41083.1 hypothetical protein [Idiomarina sp.]